MLSIQKHYLALYARLKKEQGQGMAEYGLIIALVAISVIAAISSLGLDVSSLVERINCTLGGGHKC